MNKLYCALIGSIFLLICWNPGVRAQIPEIRPGEIRDHFESSNSLFSSGTLNTEKSGIKRMPSTPAASFSLIGTAYNVFSILIEGQNQVAYVPDLDLVTFAHRQNNGTVGGSGGISFDVSPDRGMNWNLNTILTPSYNSGEIPENAGNRYPNCTLYNPPGNNEPDSAFIAAAGPALKVYGAGDSRWGIQFRASSKIDGSEISETYHEATDFTEHFPFGMSTHPDGSIWYCSSVIDVSGVPGADSVNATRFRLYKGVFNASTKSFDYELKADLNPSYFAYEDAGHPNYYSTFALNMAFSPDGSTAYAVILGGPEEAVEITPKPMVWKSTDSGETWNYLPDFSFGTLPAFQDFVVATEGGTGVILPFFLTLDVTVDALNRLHLVSEVNGRVSTTDNADSLYLLYDFVNSKGIFHCYTSDGTDWEAALIDTVRTKDGGLLRPDGSALEVKTSAQLGRTEDGTKIFFTWAASDQELVETNDIPNLHARGFDIYSEEYTFIKDFTEGSSYNGLCYFPTQSPISINDGEVFDFEIPIVFVEPGANTNQPVQFIYLRNAGFDEDEFGMLSPVVIADFDFEVNELSVTLLNLSQNADEYIWDFGDGSNLNNLVNPVHDYLTTGTFEVCLIALNAGSIDTICKDVSVSTTSIADVSKEIPKILVYPNPASEFLMLSIQSTDKYAESIEVIDSYGRIVNRVKFPFIRDNQPIQLDISTLLSGVYFLRIRFGEGTYACSPFSVN